MARLRADGYHRVYPRVCGGTGLSAKGQRIEEGLSPRVRGNPPVGHLLDAEPGSIPACAGEPVAGEGAWLGNRVYPRVCGGTRSASSAIRFQ